MQKSGQPGQYTAQNKGTVDHNRRVDAQDLRGFRVLGAGANGAARPRAGEHPGQRQPDADGRRHHKQVLCGQRSPKYGSQRCRRQDLRDAVAWEFWDPGHTAMFTRNPIRQ